MMKSLGRKVATGFLSLVAVLALMSFAYTDAKLGFKIDYPDSWELGTSSSEDMVVAQTKFESDSDDFRENMNVIAAPVEGNISLETLYNLNYENAQKMLEEFTPIEVQKVKIGGEDAIRLVYTFRYKTTTLKNIVYMLIHDNKMYALTFATVVPHYDEFSPVFDKIAQSITFIDEPKVVEEAVVTPKTPEMMTAPAVDVPVEKPVSEPALVPAGK